MICPEYFDRPNINTQSVKWIKQTNIGKNRPCVRLKQQVSARVLRNLMRDLTGIFAPLYSKTNIITNLQHRAWAKTVPRRMVKHTRVASTAVWTQHVLRPGKLVGAPYISKLSLTYTLDFLS